MTPILRSGYDYVRKHLNSLNKKKLFSLIPVSLVCLATLAGAAFGIMPLTGVGTAKDTPDLVASRVKPQSGQETRDYPVTVSRGATDRDTVYVLAKVIQGEAADEPYTGKVAVGAVIVNRTRTHGFPNTVQGVIYQPWAFESVMNGQDDRPLSRDAVNAAQAALNGEDPTHGATYFWNPAKVGANWVWSQPVITQIGNQVFAK